MGQQDIGAKLLAIFYSGGLGVLGGLANMLYRHAKGEEFKLAHWIVSLLLSFLVAWMIGEFIPHDFSFRDGLLGISGATSMTLMNLIQLYGGKFVLKQTPLSPLVEDEEGKKKE